MVRHRKERTSTQEAVRDSVLAQEDEADILAEVGGERDESGTLVVDEDRVRAIGTVDVESIRANRRADEFASKKRAKVPGVTFGSDDVLERYETLLKICEPGMLDISVKCRTGNGPQHMIKSRPRSGTALYEAISAIHGQREEAEYEVRCLDTITRQYRLNGGRIVMPDTRPQGQQGQPMHYPQHPAQGYPPGYVVQAPQPQQPTQVFASPSDPMAMMRQMFEMFQTMQQQVAGAPPAPQYPQAPPPVQMPTNPTEMMAEMFRLFQQAQQSQTSRPVAAPPPPPPPQSPDTTVSRLTEMREMFEILRDMQLAMQPPPPPRGPPRSSYYPQGDQERSAPPYYPQGRPSYPGAPQRAPTPTPPPPRTAAEQFRDSMAVIRDAANALNEIDTMLPGRRDETPVAADDDDDSPVRVIDTGPAKIVVDRTDGSLRFWETGFANAGSMFKWVSEQREAIQRAAAERQRPQPQHTQQLAPGYVEVGPGYQPPPGYVAVRIDPAQQQQDDLPPPPAAMPPPLQETPRATWGAPTVPDQT